MSIRVDLDSRTLTAPVGELVRAGVGRDIGLAGGGLARLWLGQQGHQRVQQARLQEVPGYQPELPVGGRIELDGWTLQLSGRADGVVLDEADAALEVEEIKTVHLGRDLFGPTHDRRVDQFRDQLRLYARLLSPEGAPVTAMLTLVDVFDGRELRQEVAWSARGVDSYLRRKLHLLVGHAEQRRRHLTECAVAASELPFPHPLVRPVQEPMMEAVEDAMQSGRHLLVAAPTGVGKTAAALHPALRHALADGHRVVFLTAKTLGQEMAVKTTRAMQLEDSPWHSLQLRAKSAMCANEEMVCHEEVCPYALDYARKVADANLIPELLAAYRHLDPDDIFAAAQLRQVCPFELSLDLLGDVELVICDYNYVFDPRIGLDAVAGPGTLEDSVLVIDEAHNLVDRAREYYSPSLSLGLVQDALDLLAPRTTQLFGDLQDVIGDVREYLLDSLEDAFLGAPDGEGTAYADLDAAPLLRARQQLDPLVIRYVQFKQDQQLWGSDDAVMALYFHLTHFHRVLALGGEEFVQLASRSRDADRLHILCLDASRFVGDVLDGSAGAVAMSATLEPFEFYNDLLGFDPDGTDALSLPSPFPRDNCLVAVADGVDTTYRQRRRHYDAIARLIGESAPQGRNALALFPSYAFLSEIASRIDAPDHRIEVQRANDRWHQREMLRLMGRGAGEPVLLLAVLGGVYAEGVDYPGEMLSTVYVVSPGLPQVEPERELLKGYLQRAYGDGFGYAYLIPGLRRVVQAAGRLIRSETDRGAIVLIGRRFLDRRYASLLPADWVGDDVRQLRTGDPAAALSEFFGEPD